MATRKRFMGKGMQMNFGENSHRLLKYEKAKAKLNEFAVADEAQRSNNLLGKTSIDLLYSTIRVLSEYAQAYCEGKEINNLYKDLSFVAEYYEKYIEATNDKNDYFFLLVGAIANVLSDNFGNAKSLLIKIDKTQNINPIAGLVLDYLSIGLNPFRQKITPNIDEKLNSYYLEPLENELTKEDQPSCEEKLKYLVRKTLRGTNAESAFFANQLVAVRKKYIENSSLKNIPLYSNSKLSDWKKYFQQSKAIRVLWQAQKLLLDKDILKGKSATIQLPTGVGKTKSIELFISAAFLLHNVSLAIVVAPLRALCNEIEIDLKKSLHYIVSITDISDVLIEEEEFDFDKQQVLVLTPEKLSFLIKHDNSIIQKCGLIIFDEAHMFDAGTRGAAYEMLILKVKQLLPDEAQKIFISAVMPNAEDLNKWLTDGKGVIVADKDIKRTEKSIGFFSQIKNQLLFYDQVELIRNDNQMVFIPQICPVHPFIIDTYKRQTKNKRIGDPKVLFPTRTKSLDVALYLACNLCKKGSVAVYVNRPKYISSIAKKIKELSEKGYKKLEDIGLNTDKEEANKIYCLAQEHFGAHNDFIDIMCLGVFPHFGKLENGLRISIEYAIKQQKITCVLCTSTLAEGVNLPIRYLIVTSFNDAFGQRLSTRKFQNLLGRTARSGIYTEGSLLCSDPKVYDKKEEKPYEWQKIIELFDPSNNENCNSIILEIFNDLKISYMGDIISGENLVERYLANYREGIIEFNIDKLLNNINQITEECNIALRKDVDYIITARISLIKKVIETLETTILEEQIAGNTFNLVQQTLAYQLASIKQKELLIKLFETIEEKVEKVPTEKRLMYAKTMNGIDVLTQIENYLEEKRKMFLGCKFEEDCWINMIIEMTEFYKVSKTYVELGKLKQKSLICGWIEGKSYEELQSSIGIDMYQLEEICQDDMGYSLNLLLSCVIELIEQYRPKKISARQWNIFIGDISFFQQRIKYGLLDSAEIAAYEFGFADRIIARKVAKLLYRYGEQTIEQYKLFLLDIKDEIKNILKPYPSYFSSIIS